MKLAAEHFYVISRFGTRPNPTRSDLNPTRPNPRRAQPDPTQPAKVATFPNPTQPNPTQPDPTRGWTHPADNSGIACNGYSEAIYS